jgi:hypothetical protein
MINSKAWLVALCLGVVGTSGPAFANTYLLELDNVDDVMTAYITNSGNSDTQILTETYQGDTGLVDISGYVTPGLNDILVQDFNSGGGWTYGYLFEINGVPYASGNCGTAGSIGCDGNDQTPGIVLSTDITFNVSATPLPSTWTMLIAGFVGLGFFAYRGTKKRSAALLAA